MIGIIESQLYHPAATARRARIRSFSPVLYYLHIPKSAGTSVRSLFRRVYGANLVEVYQRIDAAYVRSLDAVCRPESVLFGHFSFSLHLLLGDPEPSYMTILRHPIDRVISWYRAALRDPSSEHFARIERDRLTLAEAVELGIAAETNNHSVRVLSGNYLNWNFKYRTLDRAARLIGKRCYQFNGRRYLDAAVANMNRFFGFVGITEQMDQLARFLAESTGLAPDDIAVPFENVAPASKLDVDSQTLEVISKANELDLRLYEKVAANIKKGGPWCPIEIGRPSLRSRINVARLAVSSGGLADRKPPREGLSETAGSHVRR
jgi:Sulfotransferase family